MIGKLVLLFALSAALLFVEQSGQLQLSFSTNVTALQRGQAFKAQCKVLDYDPKNESFRIFFYRDSLWISDFFSYVNTTTHHRQTTFTLNKGTMNDDLLRLKLSATFPVYEMAISHKDLDEFSFDYYCNFFNKSATSSGASAKANVFSNKVTVSGNMLLPSDLFFFANVTKFEVGKPFTATCTLPNTAVAIKNYTVKFMSTGGQLGAYDVFGGHTLFVESTGVKNILVKHGRKLDSLHFEVYLTVVKAVDAKQKFWCTLADKSKPNSTELKSNIWPNLPEVAFSASVPAHKDGVPFTGKCTISNFTPTWQDYAVGFFIDNFGMLAEYKIRPREFEDFVVRLHSNVTVSHGAVIDFPVFEFAVNMTGPKQPFWCALTVENGANGTEYKSNQLSL